MSDTERPETVVGRRMKELRHERGWSQLDLATKMKSAGFSWRQTTVTKAEAATRPLRVDELAKLSEIFDVPVTVLLTPYTADEEEALRAELLAARDRLVMTEAAIKGTQAMLRSSQQTLDSHIRQRERYERELRDLEEELGALRAQPGTQDG